MTVFGKVFGRGSKETPVDPLQSVKIEVAEAIALCSLAGFRGFKVRQILLTIPDFKKVDLKEYDPHELDKTFLGMSSRRDPALMNLLEHGASAAALRTQAIDLYKRDVLDKERAPPDSEDAVKEEGRMYLRRWREQIRQLNVYERRQLELKFEREISDYVAKMDVKEAVKILDERDVKRMKNLDAFERGLPERRDSMKVSKHVKLNNRIPVTPQNLRDGYKNSSMAMSTEQFLQLPRAASSDQPALRPGSAQSVDPEGFFKPRPSI